MQNKNEKPEMWRSSTQTHRPAHTHTRTRSAHAHVAHTQHTRTHAHVAHAQHTAKQCPHTYSSGPHTRSSVRGCKSGESLKRVLLPCGSRGEKNTELWFSIVLRGSGSAKSDHAITCHFARLLTPRARATEPGRGPTWRLVCRWPPCVHHSREGEKKPAAGTEKVADVQAKCISYI